MILFILLFFGEEGSSATRTIETHSTDIRKFVVRVQLKFDDLSAIRKNARLSDSVQTRGLYGSASELEFQLQRKFQFSASFFNFRSNVSRSLAD